MPRVPYKNLMQSDEMAEKLEMSTAEIGLSVRTTNCLEEKGIFTVHDLLNCTRADLLSISNFGEKTLEEVFKALEKIGFFRAQPSSGELAERQPEAAARCS
jgi:DNA-directed RNA polymerase subunit alpha